MQKFIVKVLYLTFLICLIQLIICDDNEIEDRASDEIIGAWLDNQNRTVYICRAWDVEDVYITWSRPGAPRNITGWATGLISEDRIEGEYYALTNASYSDRVDSGSFSFEKHEDSGTWEGSMEDDEWNLIIRYYTREPGPAVCFKPAKNETTRAKMPGRWQRTTSSGDTIVLDICAEAEGKFQYAFTSQGGEIEGDFYEGTLVWVGERCLSKNWTCGGMILAQIGASVLVEVYTDDKGNYVERQTYNYISRGEDCEPFKYPPPPTQLWILFVFPGVVVFYYLMALVRYKMKGKPLYVAIKECFRPSSKKPKRTQSRVKLATNDANDSPNDSSEKN
eukprot:TRINITY_DN1120_c0_g1_i1.p1 TRINITY_DN1120_c0_g1~~TRINITY_DN1120_c0_g1_i1.p1  ORF type:complete len:335 (-),score=177.27 TRINITY_DN1120_c0_g1_i1:236-1240(-)